MTELRRVAPTTVGATILLVILLGIRPVAVSTILAGYAIALAAIALAGLTMSLTAARHETQSRFEAELARERIPPGRPPELVRVERELTLGSSNARQWEHRLRPLLREIAGPRLERLDADTRRLLEPSGPTADVRAVGPPLARIARVVDALERL